MVLEYMNHDLNGLLKRVNRRMEAGQVSSFLLEECVFDGPYNEDLTKHCFGSAG